MLVLAFSDGMGLAVSAGLAFVFIAAVMWATWLVLRRRPPDHEVDGVAWLMVGSISGGTLAALAMMALI